jgi:hypothetical protein
MFMFRGLFKNKISEPSKWSDSFSERFCDQGIEELTLNRNLRWQGCNDYSFLLQLRESLKTLTIIDFSKNVDIRVISELNLESLILEVGINAKWPTTFPNKIKSLKYAAEKSSPEVAGLDNLEELWIWGRVPWKRLPSFKSVKLKLISADCKYLDSLSFEHPSNIESIIVSNVTNLQIGKASGFPSLRSLEIFDAKGEIDLAPLKDARNLTKLSLDGNRLRIPTLSPLKETKSLEYLFLGETMIEDNMCSVITEIKSIKNLFFKDRKSYDITLSEALHVLKAKRIGR